MKSFSLNKVSCKNSSRIPKGLQTNARRCPASIECRNGGLRTEPLIALKNV